MRRASVCDLRYRFSAIERLLQQGQRIEITRRKRVIARLLPAGPAIPRRRPDFLARLRSIYGDKTLKASGVEVLASERDRY